MKLLKYLSPLFIVSTLCIPLHSCAQDQHKEVITDTLPERDTLIYSSIFNPEYYSQFHNTWIEVGKGLSYIEMDAPKKSNVNDSKISILKINPALVEFEMLSATQFDSSSLCVVDWAEKKNLNVVINASMYDLRNQLSSKGILQNSKEHANNPNFYEGYNAVICFNPLHSGLPAFDIVDLKCQNMSYVKQNYASFAQGLRMLDCEGNPMSWNKNPQSCSQLVVAKDDNQNVYFIFSRSPYTHNQMIHFMKGFDLNLKNAIYMEGGPQTSLFIDSDIYRIEKLGSYVSRTYPTDKNSEFWKLPNVIGIRIK